MSGVSPEVLSECLDQIEKGAGIAECLAEHPASAAELEGLLRVAAVIAPPTAEPDPVCRARGRASLLAAITAEPRAAATASLPQRLWSALTGTLCLPMNQGRRLALPVPAIIVLALLLAFSGGGAVYASQDALPGDYLYGVKTAVEDVQLQLATTEQTRTQVHLDLAAKRLAEMERLATQARFEETNRLATQYEQHLSQAGVLTPEPNTAEGDAKLAKLQEQLQTRERVLAQTNAEASGNEVPLLAQLQQELRILARIRQQQQVDQPGQGKGANQQQGQARDQVQQRDQARDQQHLNQTPVPQVEIPDSLASLREEVAKLDTGETGSYVNGLLAKLDSIQAALERGDVPTALNMLSAFGNELAAAERSGHLSADEYECILGLYTGLVDDDLGGTVDLPPANPTSPRQQLRPDESVGPRGPQEPPASTEAPGGNQPSETTAPPAESGPQMGGQAGEGSGGDSPMGQQGPGH
ncbi:MAG: DUF5667 domain-containing protein [Dehalococcoidales bacterium]|nr:DUF5667 domain-containing protein [Dehalococcoidales bacterium]